MRLLPGVDPLGSGGRQTFVSGLQRVHGLLLRVKCVLDQVRVLDPLGFRLVQLLAAVGDCVLRPHQVKLCPFDGPSGVVFFVPCVDRVVDYPEDLAGELVGLFQVVIDPATGALLRFVEPLLRVLQSVNGVPLAE